MAIGVTLEGKKEVLGPWSSASEGAKFWMSVVTELRNRGVKDIFIASVDGDQKRSRKVTCQGIRRPLRLWCT